MSNKLYNGNNTDYFVEGSGNKGYLKKSGKSYPGDGTAGQLIKNYSDDDNILEKGDAQERSWFSKGKGSVATGFRGPQGKL